MVTRRYKIYSLRIKKYTSNKSKIKHVSNHPHDIPGLRERRTVTTLEIGQQHEMGWNLGGDSKS